MVERSDRAAVATLYSPATPATGATLTLDEGAAHHARVRRLGEGDVVRLTDGRGTIAEARIARLARSAVDVVVDAVRHVPRPAPLHLFVPVADKDRMLWLAEKATELAITVWQPVVFRRSLNVNPRGSGAAFEAKARARMIAALEQSAGAWLPEMRAELPSSGAAMEATSLDRFVLDLGGVPLARHSPRVDAAIVVGPEGGMEDSELRAFLDHGWRAASLGRTTLRFETAAVSAIALFRGHFAHE